ncbi:LexA family protein [Vreelandella venusta]|uniref:Peptidase S24 n=1 Tax=Vreelandella venusta TaxID=44935 RepID=A0ABX2B9W8_9GAMM|nr:S24 family peptidase [Halomonas venusta]AZM96091.1 S24 family peptidase [Halomonas venusta]NPT30617.1 peptidase S24 [Halomonas venusta]
MDIFTKRYLNLRAVMEARKMKLKDLASAIDRSESQSSSFAGANPQKNIGERMARRIEEGLSLPPFSLDKDELQVTEKSNVYNFARHNDASVIADVKHVLPVVGMASAGRLMESVEDAEIEEYVPAPGPCGKNSFVLRLDGVSMLPDFKPGDRIVIDPDAEWISGDYVYACKTDGDSCSDIGTFKKIIFEEGEYYLCAANEDWQPRYTKLDKGWKIVGKARYQVKIL